MRFINGTTASNPDGSKQDETYKRHARGLQRAGSLPNNVSCTTSTAAHAAHVTYTFEPSTLESLDYEPLDSDVFRSARVHTGCQRLLDNMSRWMLCVLIGVSTAGAAVLVNMSVENIAALKISMTHQLLVRGRWEAFTWLCSFDLLLVMCSACICLFWAPAAIGSGIPDVKAYLNGVDVEDALSPSTLLAKVPAVIGSVASGLAVGKEGPFVHIGACIGAVLSRGMARAMRTLHDVSLFTADWEVQDWVTCGASAGVAAAFRAPVGGVLFALEELMSWWRTKVLWHAFATTAIVSVVLRLALKWCSNGACGWFGKNHGVLVFNMTGGQDDYEAYELLPMLLLGVVGGLLGSAFNSITQVLAVWRQERLGLKSGWKLRFLEVMFVSLLTSTAAFMLSSSVKCTPCPRDTREMCPSPAPFLGNFISFGCDKPKHYNEMATLIFTTQDDAIRNLFSANTAEEYSTQVLLTYFLVFFFLSILTYGIAVPSGLFVPCIVCGATYGRFVGMMVISSFPDTHMDEGTYALLGAASFLGGAMRSTVSLCVMLLELTGHLSLLPLIMLVLLVAKAVGDSTGVRAIYHLLMDLRHFPYLDPSPPRRAQELTAAAACSTPVHSLRQVERVGTLLDVLQHTQHNGFPVTVGAKGAADCIYGVVLRQQLLVLLHSKRSFQLDAQAGRGPLKQHNPSDFTRDHWKSLSGLKLSTEELDMYIDLTPYLTPLSYCVPEDASLAKVYSLFRLLGLRHLCVIPSQQPCRGIITRKDLLPENINRCVGGQRESNSKSRGAQALDVAAVSSAVRMVSPAPHRRLAAGRAAAEEGGQVLDGLP